MTCKKLSFSLWAMILYFSVFQVHTNPILTSSDRSLLYLHTTPASWGSARDTCSRYGAHLVNAEDMDRIEGDIFVLDNFLQWGGSFSNLHTGLWTGLHKSTMDSELYWHRCKPFDYINSNSLLMNVADQLKLNTLCTSMDTDFHLSATSCDAQLPYVCQIEEGECWFLPVEDMAIVEVTPAFEGPIDINECAQKCRERNVSAGGHECWGFTYNETTEECQLYENNVHYPYLRDITSSLVDAPDAKTFLKICTGGEVTSMAPTLPMDTSTHPEADNCSAGVFVGTVWDDDVCYCDCDLPPAVLEPSQLALTMDQRIDNIVNYLIIDPSNTSAAHRKLTSADDNRPSATSLGSFGVTVLTLVFGSVLFQDVHTLMKHLTACLTQRHETDGLVQKGREVIEQLAKRKRGLRK